MKSVARAHLVLLVEVLQAPLDGGKRIRIEQLAQLRVPEQLAQLRLVH